jgi:hypothetical protein
MKNASHSDITPRSEAVAYLPKPLSIIHTHRLSRGDGSLSSNRLLPHRRDQILLRQRLEKFRRPPSLIQTKTAHPLIKHRLLQLQKVLPLPLAVSFRPVLKQQKEYLLDALQEVCHLPKTSI